LTPAFEERDAQRRLDPRGARREFDGSRRDFSERDRDVLVAAPEAVSGATRRLGAAPMPCR